MSDLFHNKNFSPMLLHEVKEPFDDKDYIYELKLDGIRCIAYLGKDVVLQNKRYKDVSAIYPELSDMNLGSISTRMRYGLNPNLLVQFTTCMKRITAVCVSLCGRD